MLGVVHMPQRLLLSGRYAELLQVRTDLFQRVSLSLRA